MNDQSHEEHMLAMANKCLRIIRQRNEARQRCEQLALRNEQLEAENERLRSMNAEVQR